MTTKSIEKEALKLKSNDKIRLVEVLLNSLDKPDPEIETAWVKEAEARYNAADKGTLKVISSDKVLKNLKRKK